MPKTTKRRPLPICGACDGYADPNPQACWWCLADLCNACWEAQGECGHPGAKMFQERAEWNRKNGLPLLPIPDPALNARRPRGKAARGK